jgi:HlyD family secretion protein
MDAPTARTAAAPTRYKTTKIIAALVVLIAVAALAAYALFAGGEGQTDSAWKVTHQVVRGDLTVSILTTGNLEAIRKQEITSKVKGRTTILKIVEEGVLISEKDVKDKKVLIELDSAKLKEELEQQEIYVAAAGAALAQARESYDIQRQDNLSNVRKGKLALEFARMDFERCVGEKLSAGLSEEEIDFSAMARSDDLGGKALQERRNLKSDIELAREEVSRATNKKVWTTKLADAGYVTKDELEADLIAFRRNEVSLEKAHTALELFMKYKFIKDSKKTYADWREAQHELGRIQAKARSELAHAEASLRSKEATSKLRLDKLKKIKEQIGHCTIQAKQVGLVVYASSTDWRGNVRNIIAEGEEVRERQKLLAVPDTSAMQVKVKVHESVVKRVKVGQTAAIAIEALNNLKLGGEVTKVAILPDATNWWLNPDLKEYSVTVNVQGQHKDLKPGMSVKAEIVIEELKDVLKAPVHAIQADEDRVYCMVRTPRGPAARDVKTGASNDTFIEVKEGLKEGDQLYLKRIVATTPTAQEMRPSPTSEGAGDAR